MPPTDTSCAMDSIGDLNPQNICMCARDLVQALAEIKAMMEDPQKVIESLMVENSYLFGPKKIGSSPGWWFTVYRPDIEITSSNEMKIKLKAGVKKTRGALQFGWRKADHTFTIPLPPEVEKYQQLTAKVAAIESQLNLMVNNVCGPLGY